MMPSPWERLPRGGSGPRRGRGPPPRGGRWSTAPGVELLGHLVVVVEQRLGVDAGEVEHAHVAVSLLHPLTPEADVLHRGHDAGEEARPELAHLIGLHG